MDYFFQEFQESDETVELSENESKHIHKVLRKREGDQIGLLNGNGVKAEAEILSYSGKKISAKILSKEVFQNDQSKNLIIAIAPTKNIDRYEYFLEKATEIGVGEIVPLLSSNSERKVIKKDRLQKILVAAMKQSKRTFLPVLQDLTSFSDWLENDASESKFIAHCESDKEKKSFVKEVNCSKKTTILIGPEGDFSINEIKLALDKGYQAVSLGESRLRTETAGIFASVCFNL